MNSSNTRLPALRSPLPPSPPPDRARSASRQPPSGPPSSASSDASLSPNLSAAKRPPGHDPLPTFDPRNSSNTSLPYLRPSAVYMPQDGIRRVSPSAPPPANLQKHRPRQHSQGYFEPSMPSASLASQSTLHDNSMSGLSASQAAAQAAFQHLHTGATAGQHNRRRSQTVPFPEAPQDTRRSSKGSATSSQDEAQVATSEKPQYRNGLVGNNAATSAASAAFPRNHASTSSTALAEEREPKRGLKRFKPKSITLSRDKDKEARDRVLPSPNKLAPSGLSKVMNASTTSLADSLSSTNTSLFSLANPSQTTIIPVPEAKDKSHKHGLRQKLKLKDKDDHHALPLSSAHSTSRPVDVNNPQSLYSFAPSTGGPTSSFAKTVSSLDLRPGGRALREKKKEEKAQAQAALDHVLSRDGDSMEWPSSGPTPANASSSWTPYSSDLTHTLNSFGVNNMTADDAWDFLQAKLLAVFEGEVVRIAVEDLNRLVAIHVQRCVQKRDPSIVVGNLEELLHTGFLSLNNTIRAIPDDRLVPYLISKWMMVFGHVLPFMQAVFLPLDQEFKGRGSILTTPKMAAEFWGVVHNPESLLSSSPNSRGQDEEVTAAGEQLEVRRILLIQYRDIVILPRFEKLKATFSRLSLESINATLVHLEDAGRARGNSDGSDWRSAASGSQALDPTFASFNSQASTLLDSSSSHARSRATSSLSNASNPAQDVAFQSFSSPPAARPTDNSSAQVTETVGRMLQCLSVLCSVQTGDGPQAKMEELNKQLKLNWLGRGRTGRNRKGFIGTRMRSMRSVGSTIRGERDGSPTPTPTRQGTVSRQVEDA
ncbi:hypothetical protein DV737_g2209, partial [Chaetothyriales sp. CBS 132003]